MAKTNLGPPIFKTYTQDEMPDNMQQLDIVEAQQIIDDIPVTIDPKQVRIDRATQTIRLNLSISIPNKGQNEGEGDE